MSLPKAPASVLFRLTILLVAGACFPFTPLTCGPAPEPGQFGPYVGPFKLIRLVSGDTFTVYRVKSWTFTNGGSALQLEYQTRVDIYDTTAVKAEAARLWTVFRPYVEQTSLASAILTATDRRYQGNAIGHVSLNHSFGVILVRDSSGAWQREGEYMPLPDPAPLSASGEGGVGIFERNGQPLVIPPSLRAHANVTPNGPSK